MPWSERQLHVGQITAGFHQHQWTLVDHHGRCALARHMHRARLGRDDGLHGGHFVGVGVDPLQATAAGNGLQLRHRQRVGLHARQAGRCRGAGCSGRRGS